MSLAWPKDFHNHFVIINVSGFRYLLKKRTILRHPKTRLAEIISNEATNGRELYAERNPYMFPYVADFYRCGVLHIPLNTYCWTAVREELIFWGISLDSMRDCCTIPLSDDLRALDKRKKTQMQFGDYLERIKKRDVELVARGRSPGFTRGYYFLYQPWFTVTGRTYTFIYTLLTLFYAFTFAFECDFNSRVTTKTEQHLYECFGNDSDISPSRKPWNLTLQKAQREKNWIFVYQLTQPAEIFTFLDGACLFIFAFDLAFRFVFYPVVVAFFFVPLHIIDTVSLFVNVAAFYFGHIAYSPFWCTSSNVTIYFALEVFRIVRLLRLFCISHKYSWFNVLYLTFKDTIVELGLLIGFLSLGVILFGLAIYIPELDGDGSIVDPFQGFWYAIVTMTTLGYGDFIPSSPAGLAVGGLCCTSGVIFVSLQIPLIASIFGDLYDYAQEQVVLTREKEEEKRAAKKEAENDNAGGGTTKSRVGGVVSFDERSAKSAKSATKSVRSQ